MPAVLLNRRVNQIRLVRQKISQIRTVKVAAQTQTFSALNKPCGNFKVISRAREGFFLQQIAADSQALQIHLTIPFVIVKSSKIFPSTV